MKRVWAILAVCALLLACMTGCMQSETRDEREDEAKKPQLPEKLKLDDNGVPVLNVYDLGDERTIQMDIESYLEGVLAGEMRSDWPEEALKAQAILARTFVVKFVETKDSTYENADISTDVTEAQAYAPKLVDDRIRAAVAATRGEVVSYDGEIANTWFHAHSGGRTELPTVSLDYKENPPYTESVNGMESEDAPEGVKEWKATFTRDEIREAMKEAGVPVDTVQTVAVGDTGESGRAQTLEIGGRTVSAATLRIRLGADKLKSTLITDITQEGDEITFTGRGYGHGVGMSQWGAYAMAKDGQDAKQIIDHYYKDVSIEKLWS